MRVVSTVGSSPRVSVRDEPSVTWPRFLLSAGSAVPPGRATDSDAVSRRSEKNFLCHEPIEVNADVWSLPPSCVIRRYGRSSSHPTTPTSQISTTWSQPARVGVLMMRSTAKR